MKRFAGLVAAFLVGAATGSFLTVAISQATVSKAHSSDIEVFTYDQLKKENESVVQVEIAATDKEMEELEEAFGDILDQAPEDDDLVRDPFIISKEEWRNEFPEAEEQSITYYQRDGVFLDERDFVIEHPEDFVGASVITILEDTHEDILYVHNDEFNTDYEIVVDHDKYSTDYAIRDENND